MCQITLLYYVGFAYVMMRRYRDAIITFSSLLTFVQRTKQMFPNRAQLYDQDVKTAEKGLMLLALSHALCPVPIDESVRQQIREKLGSADRLARLQRGDVEEFEQLFLMACPKFLSIGPPNYDRQSQTGDEKTKEPLMHHLQLFLKEVTQQQTAITVRNYLKLYTSIPLAKLASLLQTDTDSLKSMLMTLKHKTCNITGDATRGALSGTFQPAQLPINFYIENDVIHVADMKASRQSEEYFVQQTAKLGETIRLLKAINAAQNTVPAATLAPNPVQMGRGSFSRQKGAQV